MFSQETGVAVCEESCQLFQAVIRDRGVLPYQRALAEYHYGLAELKFGRNGGASVKLSGETAALVSDAVRVFQSKQRALEPGIEIKEMATNISNAQKVLNAAADKSLTADDIDWVVMR